VTRNDELSRGDGVHPGVSWSSPHYWHNLPEVQSFTCLHVPVNPPDPLHVSPTAASDPLIRERRKPESR
jgi:hypothetical protein